MIEYSSVSVDSHRSKITCIVKEGVFDSASDEYGGNLESLTYYKTVGEVYDFIEEMTISCEKSINSKESSLKGVIINVEHNGINITIQQK